MFPQALKLMCCGMDLEGPISLHTERERASELMLDENLQKTESGLGEFGG